MKIRLLLILLLISNIGNSQNWEQVGTQQFTNVASDGGIGFNPTTGSTYMAYIDASNNNNVRVMEYNGTSWVNLGSLVSTDDAMSPSINVNPVTNEVWVAYIRTSDNTLSVYNYDGTNWSVVGSGLGNGNLIDRRTRIRFNASGIPRISARNTTNSVQCFIKYVNNTWNFTTISGQAEDLTSFDKCYIANSQSGSRYDIDAIIADYSVTNLYPPNTVRNISRISGIDDMTYISYLDIADRARVFFNNTNLLTTITGNRNGTIKLRKSAKDGNIYFIYNDVNDQLALIKINPIGNAVTTLVAPSIPTSDPAFFADVEMNPVTGDYYTLYKDGTKISVKKYNVMPFLPRYYVNINATGNNDGSSWTDAYNDLNDALNSYQDNKEVWIAGGTYNPSPSNRSVAYTIYGDNIEIYGGFAGTETQLSERVIGANETILSGDLQGNDVNVADFISNYSNTTRNADNSYHIINITETGNNLLLEGLTISDAHNNLNATERGGAIIKHKSIANLTLKDCVVKDNVSRNDNAGLDAEFELNNTAGARGELIIENCKFINNMSRRATSIYSFVRANTNVDLTVANSLFDKNVAGNLNTTTATGGSGSASWFKVIANGSDVALNLYNNTYVNNTDLGTANSLNNSSRATVAISMSSSSITSTFNAIVSNCIFRFNTTTGGAIARSITDLSEAPITSLAVSNSLDPLNFNDDSISTLTATSNADPLFVSLVNGDYSLMSGSPAIDSGNNTYVLGTSDLLGNQRVFNTTVDMGAYEFGSPSLSSNSFTTYNDFIIYPNPSTNLINIQSKEVINRITIYSLDGRKVLETNKKEINISNLDSGIYLVNLQTESGAIGTKKIIKK
ncbi:MULTISPECIES: T9SS type A sorting domain-containing protein [Flavobacterium]|uniref:T9SS type A sorting domain-containing protein n=1 Tax=Flavobacterium jumunjinense TaxID=998845 RepID=A0ABV5GPL8_9FLAO|nr:MULTISPECIES: T9SS type A sorting domain-containing protein [Flavobacterium]